MAGRTISIKGVGKAKVRPDLVSIVFTIHRQDMDYEQSVADVAEAVKALTSSIVGVGFEKSDLKTINWETEPQYNSRKKRRGDYEEYFTGYLTTHTLRFEFDLDSKKLPYVISAVAACDANPEFSISFTIKDEDAVSEQVLVEATKNAISKAKIITETSGAKLGAMQIINYHWSEYHFYSDTRFESNDTLCCMEAPVAGYRDIDIEPDDINLRDTISFEWEIE